MGFWDWFKRKQIQAETVDPVKIEAHTANAIAEEVSERKVSEEKEDEEVEEITRGSSGRVEITPFASELYSAGVLKDDIDTQLDKSFEEQEKTARRDTIKPIKIKALLTNKTLTVYLPSGDIISNTDADREMYFKVIASTSENEVKEVMLPDDQLSAIKNDKLLEEREVVAAIKKKKEILKERAFTKELSSIEETGEFKVVDDALYMKGIDITIPKPLAELLLKSGKDGDEKMYNSLKNFWRWCVLNPDPRARGDLFRFLRTGEFKITSGGMFLAYRGVDKVKEATEKDIHLTAFISSQYIRVKGQKKSPKNFEVAVTEVKGESEYKLVKPDSGEKVVGNLAELYTNLSSLEENEFTDRHTGTMKIVIGKEVNMPREECASDPGTDCAAGLHAMSKRYGSPVGNTLLLIAINPMNVVAVPSYNHNKLRCCAYMPLAIISDWVLEDEDFNTLELQEEYFGDELDKLEQMIADNTPTEIARNKLITPLEPEAYVALTNQLEAAKADLSKRVVLVK